MKMKAKGLMTTMFTVLLLWLIAASAVDNVSPVVPDNTILRSCLRRQDKEPLPSALFVLSDLRSEQIVKVTMNLGDFSLH
jgi:hypothetical protein